MFIRTLLDQKLKYLSIEYKVFHLRGTQRKDKWILVFESYLTNDLNKNYQQEAVQALRADKPSVIPTTKNVAIHLSESIETIYTTMNTNVHTLKMVNNDFSGKFFKTQLEKCIEKLLRKNDNKKTVQN